MKGTLITWTLPLSAMPGKHWRQFFAQTTDRTVTCSPQKVSMFQRIMVFESAEEDLPTWIGFIDKWMAAANARCAERDAAERRRPDEDVDTRDRAQRLVELSEKFKHL